MNLDQKDKLISIIQNSELTTEQQVNKLIRELENLNFIPAISPSVSIFESIEMEELKMKEGQLNDNLIVLDKPIFQNGLDVFHKKELLIIAGRPAMGKTQFLVHLANNIANNHSVLYHTLDVSISNLTTRFLANETGVSKNSFFNNLQDHSVNKSLVELKEIFKNKKLHLVDSSVVSLKQLKEYYSDLVQNLGIEVIIIDYLQLLSDKNYRIREQEVASVMRNLKFIAKELNVCILVASQLSRSVETRGGDKRPILSDLRESGAIEEFSDKVLFLYRPEYYQLFMDENGESTVNQVEIIVAKNNNAETQVINLERDKEFTRFTAKNQTNNTNLSWDYQVDGL